MWVCREESRGAQEGPRLRLSHLLLPALLQTQASLAGQDQGQAGPCGLSLIQGERWPEVTFRPVPWVRRGPFHKAAEQPQASTAHAPPEALGPVLVTWGAGWPP